MPTVRVLILEANVFTASALHRQVAAGDARGECLVVRRLDEARAALAMNDVGLLLSGIELPDGDVLDLLSACPARAARTLVVTWHLQSRVLASLRALTVAGVFDAAIEDPEKIGPIVRRLETGGGYWSASLQAHLFGLRARSILTQLTPTEQLALALLGDGCTDKTAAERLGMTLSATRSLRRDVHRKLGAHARADLIRLALQHGFVRVTARGILPLGEAILRREYWEHCKRPLSVASNPQRARNSSAA